MNHDFAGSRRVCRRAEDGAQKKCSECNGKGWKNGVHGECCTGYMDYTPTPNYWSLCSVRDFEQAYVSQNWQRCMRTGMYDPTVIYQEQKFAIPF